VSKIFDLKSGAEDLVTTGASANGGLLLRKELRRLGCGLAAKSTSGQEQPVRRFGKNQFAASEKERQPCCIGL
jgi:hypothetical protein